MKNKILTKIMFVIASLIVCQAAIAQTAERPQLLETPGDVWAWGFNNNGQVGADDEAANVVEPTLIATDAIFISGGENHGFYIDEDNTLWAFGANDQGQLGNGDEGATARPSPVEIADNVVYVKAIRQTSFYITSDGTLWAMGRNDVNQLGIDTGGTDVFMPVEVDDQLLTDVVAVDGGHQHTLFLTSDGTLYGIGNNSDGQLGIDPEVEDFVSQLVQIDTDVVDVASAFVTTLYIKDDGSLWSLGSNDHGQLGIDDEELGNTFTPQQVTTNVTSVNCAARQCVYIDGDGNLYGFGRGNWGQLGYSDEPVRRIYAPVEFIGGDNVVSAATGQRHSIFAKSDGTVWVTGHNDQNQMGIGAEVDQYNLPELLSVGTNNVVMVSTKGAHNLVIDQYPATSINDDNQLPSNFHLEQNYPNPFNPTTNITYSLPASEHVLLEVFDITGKKIMTLVDRQQNSGNHTVTFNAENLTSGIYMYRLNAGSFVQTKKLTLIK